MFPKVQLPERYVVPGDLQETEFGLKATIRINHLTIHEGADSTVGAFKLLYASHYFWTASSCVHYSGNGNARPGFSGHQRSQLGRSRVSLPACFVRRHVGSEVGEAACGEHSWRRQNRLEKEK